MIEDLLVDDVTIAPPSTADSFGRESHGAAVASKARVESGEVWVNSPQGWTKVQGAKIFLPKTAVIAVGAQIVTADATLICRGVERNAGFSLHHYVATCGPL